MYSNQEISRIKNFKNFVGELTVTFKRTSLPTLTISKSSDINDFIRPFFDDIMDDHEEVKVVHLNTSNKVINVHHVSRGGISATVVPIKLILRNALLIPCSSIILVHNHPSGKLIASNADLIMSKKLKKACEMVDIKFLDSIIITRENYLSFADEDLL